MLKAIEEALWEVIDDVSINVGINLEDKVVSAIKDNPKITVKKLSDLVGVSTRQIERIIKKCKEAGKLTRIGAKKNGYWKCNELSLLLLKIM